MSYANIQQLKSNLRATFAQDSGREYYAYITSDEKIIQFLIIDAEIQQQNQGIIGFKNGKEFIDRIPKLFPKHFKVLILNIFNFKNHEFSNNYEFCKFIREKLCRLRVKHHFIQSQQLTPSIIFMAANFMANIGYHVFIITDKNYNFQIVELEFTKNGYEMNRCQKIPFSKVTRDRICRSKNAAAIFGYDITLLGTCILNTLLKFDNFIMLGSERFQSIRIKGICEMAKWLKNKKFNKFHVIPTATSISFYFIHFPSFRFKTNSGVMATRLRNRIHLL